MRKIDSYTHFACPELIQHLEEKSGHAMVFRGLFSRIPHLSDVEARLRFMDERGIDVHCLVPLPWLECEPAIANDPEAALEACRVANDAMAALVARHPTRFVGVALVPMASAAAMAAEVKRAVSGLGLAGVALFVGPTAKPPDHPDIEMLWATCAAANAPVWVHPCRPQSYPDYDAYAGSGSQHQLWNTFGWIYDTSVAMVHIALAGVFRRFPDLKIVSHHHGGMVPFFTERFYTQRKNFDESDGEDLLADLSLFYCDTAAFGVSTANVRQAMDFFAERRVMFGSDTPMDMGAPGHFSDTAVASVEGLQLEVEAAAEIYYGNVMGMLGLAAGGCVSELTQLRQAQADAVDAAAAKVLAVTRLGGVSRAAGSKHAAGGSSAL